MVVGRCHTKEVDAGRSPLQKRCSARVIGAQCRTDEKQRKSIRLEFWVGDVVILYITTRSMVTLGRYQTVPAERMWRAEASVDSGCEWFIDI